MRSNMSAENLAELMDDAYLPDWPLNMVFDRAGMRVKDLSVRLLEGKVDDHAKHRDHQNDQPYQR